MFRGLNAPGYFAVGLVAAIGAWLALASLPSDPYQRYRSLYGTDYIKGRWVFERLHFDPTPVDVAFLGTSHGLSGIDSAVVETVANENSATSLHIVNLALPHYGRDVDYLLARMLLQAKRPKLLVLEADYIEFRVSHPAFPLIADTWDVLSAPVILNTGLADDLLLLPKNRLRMFAKALLSSGQDPFDVSRYAGPHWNDTYRTTMHDGRLSPPRLAHQEPRALEQDASSLIDGETAKAREYRAWGWLELRYHRFFLQRLVDAARRSGTRLAFLYLPSYGAPNEPADAATLRRYGEIWTVPPEILRDPTVWLNRSHLNYRGAQLVSSWLGERLRAGSRTAQARELSP